MDAQVGCCGYRYPDWVGTFYPRGIKTDRYLPHYAIEFNALEVDSTFYAIPSKRILETWAAKVGRDFRFFLRAPQAVTTYELDRRTRDLWERFQDSASYLGKKLGGVIFQVPALSRPQSHTERHMQLIEDYTLDVPIWAEFRNQDYMDTMILQSYLDAGWQISWSESQFLSKTIPPVNGKLGYLRLLGDRTLDRHDKVYLNRDDDMLWWVNKLGAQGFDSMTVFVSNNYMGHAPSVAKKLRRWLSEKRWERSGSRVF